ncbi:hypothetical protein Tco_1409774 [Tanacetum coccineum]
MNPVITQQVALDNALVAPEKRLKIEKCNARIKFNKPQREATYQVTLDSLKISPCYPAFLITDDVPEIYMHQFWNTIKKIKDTDAYNFKLDKKKCKVDTEVFCEILQIYPRLHNQEFVKPPFEDELIPFIQELGLDRLRESRAQILQGMFKQKNVDYVALLWEDFMYQADSREISSARKEHMPYPRFTKVIINHFISQDKTISMRNRINLHTVRNDTLLGTLKFVSKTKDSQKYRALIPDGMVNQDIKDSTTYKTYYDFATGKTKRVKRHAKKSTTTSTAGVIIRDTPGVSVSKKKAPAKADRGKGIELLSDVALLEDAQLKKVPDEHEDKTSGTDEGTDTKPGVPDVPIYESESKNESWGDSQDDKSNDVDSDVDNNSDNKDDDSKNDDEGDSDVDDCERTDSDSDEEVNLNLNSKDDEEEETQDEEYIRTPDYYDVNITPKDTELEKEGKGDAEMTDAGLKDVSQEKTYKQVIDDAHVTFTSTQKTDGSNQSSSISSDFASKFLHLDNVPPADSKVASLMNVKTNQEDSSTQAPLFLTVHVTAILETSLVPSTKAIKIVNVSSLFGFDQRVSVLEKEISQFKQVDHSAQLLSYTAEFEKKALEEKDRYIDVIEKSIKGIIKDEVKSQFPQILTKEVFDFATPVIQSIVTESLENIILTKSSSQPQSTYEAAASLTEFELKKILLDKLEKSKSYRAVKQHKDLYNALVKSYQLDKDLFDSYGKAYSLKKGREDKDKDEDPLVGSVQGLKKRKTSKDAETSKGSKSKDSKSSSSKDTKTQPKSGKSAQAEEPMFEAADTEMPHNQGTNVDQTTIDFRPPQTWISKIAQAEKPPLTFNELMNTPIDFSAYVMHNLKIDNLTQQYLVGPAFDLLKGTYKRQEYSFDLSKTLLLIEVQGRQVVLADYFINNDLEYLEEIEVRREDQTLYKFKEGDFPNLNLCDIKDMLLLLKRVEDLQLGVECYQKKLNITRPEIFRSDISNKTPYTAYNNPQGIIYQDKLKRNRLMRSDELYKFYDEMLTSVRTILHDIASNLMMNYLPKRRWSERDNSRSRIMIKKIDKQLFERRLIRNLEKFVGGRDYEEDFSLNGQYDRVIVCLTPYQVFLS